MEFIYTSESIESLASEFWSAIGNCKVFAFVGEMGAGKTTTISALCRSKGVKSSVSSPTFSIINEYHSETERIYHLDLYRLRDEAEAVQAGVEDVLYSGDYCMIEWPDKFPRLIPPEALWINIDVVDAATRKLTIVNLHGR